MTWWLAWALLTLGAGLVIVRVDIAQRRDLFLADARAAHRLLSQRAVQHDAILATLTLASPGDDGRERLTQRLAAVYPQVLDVTRRVEGRAWPIAAWTLAEQRSRAVRRPVLAEVQRPEHSYTLIQAGEPASFALHVDVHQLVPWNEWPIEKDGPVEVVLRLGDQRLVMQPGLAPGHQPLGLTDGFVFSQPLASSSQPFELNLRRPTGPSQWPWLTLGAIAVGLALLMWGGANWQQARRARHRAEELLRIGQVARLNAMGELAGGMAHELNQPLAAIVANAQAARRLLDDQPPALDTARQALVKIADQGRRAAEVVSRLRRQVELPDLSHSGQPVDLLATVRDGLELLVPQIRRLNVNVQVQGEAVRVAADPVALEQIVHNLVGNALQALADVQAAERQLTLSVQAVQGQGLLRVSDTGIGLSTEDVARVFEPFYSTRPGGLGLGLSLCESLAEAMQGQLTAQVAEPRGAVFELRLPLSGASS